MPGVSQTLSVNDLEPRLNGAATAVSRMGFEPSLRKIAVLVAAGIKENFVRGQTSDGVPWAPLKRARNRRRDRRAKKGKTQKPLRDTGILMASSTARGAPGNVSVITPHMLEYGTNIGYGGYHQHGTRFIVARPFVGISQARLDTAAQIIADDAERRLGDAI